MSSFNHIKNLPEKYMCIVISLICIKNFPIMDAFIVVGAFKANALEAPPSNYSMGRTAGKS